MIIAGLLFARVVGLMLFGLLTGSLKQLVRVMETFRLEENIAPITRKIVELHGHPIQVSTEPDKLLAFLSHYRLLLCKYR